MVAAVVAVTLLGGLAAAASASVSIGSWPRAAATFGAAAAYIPAELALGALTLLLYGLVPRLVAAGWLAYAAVAFIAFLGDGLKLPSWATHLAPTTWVGTPPAGPVDTGGVVLGVAVSVTLGLFGYVAFLRRQVPTG
jgi:ABC-2 type transport system permease protein